MVEIMSPVGSFESLAAAIQGGANSVYFGAGRLNMRSKSSQNFTVEDLHRIVEIAQEARVRTYLTLNTIMYDDDLADMRSFVDAAKEACVSAIIAADMSVIQYANQVGVEVHISTQCNITNIAAVKYYSQFADVMVTARELSLKQVAAIIEAIEREQIKGPSGKLVEIEIFAHGALCMAVSGKCYLSLDNYNSSANRGACLQVCRRPYKVFDTDGGTELEIDNEYIMSPKDLKTLNFIDRIVRGGVKVLKIEGRGRSPEYVKMVTQCYRQAVDAYLQGNFDDELIEKLNQKLGSVYNRGFWNGYYLGQTIGEWTEKYGSRATKTKLYVGKVTNYFSKLAVAEIKIETNDLKTGDEFIILGETTGVYEDICTEIRVDLISTEQAIKGDICSIPTKEPVRRNDKLYKLVMSGEL